MLEECIIHVGMHKTGSSSIQETFLKAKNIGDIGYLQLGRRSNSSGWFEKKFLAADDSKRVFHKAVEEGLTHVSSKRVLISAEILSGHQFCEHSLGTLKEVLSMFFERLSVFAYIRSPHSYMESAFQQRLKNLGSKHYTIERLYPRYRQRFERLDNVFGQDAVNLKKFDRDLLYESDVVKDFCRCNGVDVSNDLLVRVNESLGLSSAALLYLWKCYIRQGGNQKRHQSVYRDILKSVRGFESAGKKIRLSSSLTESVIKKNSADVSWMEERLGTKLVEPIGKEKGIQSESDLLSIAHAEFPKFVEYCVDTKGFSDVLGAYLQAYSSVEGGKVNNAEFSNEQLSLFKKSNIKVTDVISTFAGVLESWGEYEAEARVQLLLKKR